ncbi:hypothetical protein D9V86_00340 [Bacteroidetes/Chlorobi group bacterium ChocPot_Mid]|nr:MAG: hypothetical protein D9V86_00340 [Bacteroidetes/Chlorobi group bacterium ChocPot_Mid]
MNFVAADYYVDDKLAGKGYFLFFFFITIALKFKNEDNQSTIGFSVTIFKLDFNIEFSLLEKKIEIKEK